jgi:hypothetical protein
MNGRVVRPCEGKCGADTKHIAGLPREHVHLTAIQPVSKRAMPASRRAPEARAVDLPRF